MTRPAKSRQQWEQEIVRRQQNITPAQYPEGLHYVRADGLPKISPQPRFWLGVVLIALGLSMFGLTFPAHIAIAIVAIGAGLFLSITAMRFSSTA